ncbi:hypothetical protein SBOR_3100 [Sclerotinia borealis F-4128]|uniref:Uncharacterized protein n=1 Tax=Sclerotinia borealis (strain F-4128) TaxID=1432307 RepID=W9CKF7_SCLBF|nr:hypothetical protein SBOR_3100 [Sclerotinia borealis F-4128]
MAQPIYTFQTRPNRPVGHPYIPGIPTISGPSNNQPETIKKLLNRYSKNKSSWEWHARLRGGMQKEDSDPAPGDYYRKTAALKLPADLDADAYVRPSDEWIEENPKRKGMETMPVGRQWITGLALGRALINDPNSGAGYVSSGIPGEEVALFANPQANAAGAPLPIAGPNGSNQVPQPVAAPHNSPSAMPSPIRPLPDFYPNLASPIGLFLAGENPQDIQAAKDHAAPARAMPPPPPPSPSPFQNRYTPIADPNGPQSAFQSPQNPQTVITHTRIVRPATAAELASLPGQAPANGPLPGFNHANAFPQDGFANLELDPQERATTLARRDRPHHDPTVRLAGVPEGNMDLDEANGDEDVPFEWDDDYINGGDVKMGINDVN